MLKIATWLGWRRQPLGLVTRVQAIPNPWPCSQAPSLGCCPQFHGYTAAQSRASAGLSIRAGHTLPAEFLCHWGPDGNQEWIVPRPYKGDNSTAVFRHVHREFKDGLCLNGWKELVLGPELQWPLRMIKFPLIFLVQSRLLLRVNSLLPYAKESPSTLLG